MADPVPVRRVTSDEVASVHDHAFTSGPLSAPRLARRVRLFEPWAAAAELAKVFDASAAMTWDPAPWCPRAF